MYLMCSSCLWVDARLPWHTCARWVETPPCWFKFVDAVDYYPSGYMAFATDHHLLVLTDVGHGAVHVIDVVAKIHVGLVAAPGTIAGPRGVAAKGSLVAVSAWSDLGHGEHVVRVYEGAGAAWALVRVLAGRIGREDGVLSGPAGLRFTADGTGLVVADSFNNRVSRMDLSSATWALISCRPRTCRSVRVAGLWPAVQIAPLRLLMVVVGSAKTCAYGTLLLWPWCPARS